MIRASSKASRTRVGQAWALERKGLKFEGAEVLTAEES